MKKLLFVTALNPEMELDLRQPSLGVEYMAAMNRRERPGHWDIAYADRSVGHTLDTFEPDVVAISSTSPYFGRATQYARLAKARGLPTVVGGDACRYRPLAQGYTGILCSVRRQSRDAITSSPHLSDCQL